MKPTLYMLEGHTLSSVCFVLDYIELQFSGMVLTALAAPILFLDERSFVVDAPGYRDALCGQIGKSVRSTSEGGKSISVTFEDGSRVVIPLNISDPPGPEMATLSGNRQFYAAWTRVEG